MIKQLPYYVYLILIVIGCGIPNHSTLKGTYGEEPFTLIGKVSKVSRHEKRVHCALGLSFYPAGPLGDRVSFTFGLKDKDMYQGFSEQVNKNILTHVENRMDAFYMLGYTDRPIEINMDNAVEGDFIIIEKVELLDKRLRTTFEEVNKAVVIEGEMKLHFDDKIIHADFEFVLGQCYNQSFL